MLQNLLLVLVMYPWESIHGYIRTRGLQVFPRICLWVPTGHSYSCHALDYGYGVLDVNNTAMPGEDIPTPRASPESKQTPPFIPDTPDAPDALSTDPPSHQERLRNDAEVRV